MADDPDRDILPVKDGAEYGGKSKSLSFGLDDRGSFTVPLQNQYVSKLERLELEDRYIRLCDDNLQLKKLCNEQENKIKRLATKLLRMVSDRKNQLSTPNQRHQMVHEEIVNDQQLRIRELEQANAVLQERLMVLKQQLASHSRMHGTAHCISGSRSSSRSPSRQRIMQNVDSFRSMESAQILHGPESEELPQRDVGSAHQEYQRLMNEVESLRQQIRAMEEEMHVLRSQASTCSNELKQELAATASLEGQRRELADNVELIRLNRLLKQQASQATVLQAHHQAAEREVSQVRQDLEIAQKENESLHQQLLVQKQKVSELQLEVTRFSSLQQAVREMQEQILDIQREKAALKEHNSHLLLLSASALSAEQTRQKHISDHEVGLTAKVAQLEVSLSSELTGKCSALANLEEERKQLKAMREAQAILQTSYNDLEKKFKEATIQVERIPTLEKNLSMMKSQQKMLQDELNRQCQQILYAKICSCRKDTHDIEQIQAFEHMQTYCFDNVSSNQSSDQSFFGEKNSRNRGNSLDQAEGVCVSDVPNERSSNHPLLDETAPQGPSLKQTQTFLQPLLKPLQDCKTYNGSAANCCNPPTEATNVPVSTNSQADEIDSSVQQDLSKMSEISSLGGEQTETISRGMVVLDNSLPSSSANTTTIITSCNKGSECIPLSPMTLEEMMAIVIKGDTLDTKNDEAGMCAVRSREMNKATTASCLEASRELEKCRELLRVQYNLNSMYKKEVFNLNEQLTRREQEQSNRLDIMCNLLETHTKTIQKLGQSSRVRDSLLQSDSKLRLAGSEDDFYESAQSKARTSILQQDEEDGGLFSLHIRRVQLLLNVEKYLEPPNFYVRWVFYKFNALSTPPTHGPDCKFQYTTLYKVPLNDNFFDYLMNGDCVVEVHMASKVKVEVISSFRLRFSEVFTNSQNRVEAKITLKADSRIDEAEAHEDIGMLHCYFQLVCPKECIEDYLERHTNKPQLLLDSHKLCSPVPAPRPSKRKLITPAQGVEVLKTTRNKSELSIGTDSMDSIENPEAFRQRILERTSVQERILALPREPDVIAAGPPPTTSDTNELSTFRSKEEMYRRNKASSRSPGSSRHSNQHIPGNPLQKTVEEDSENDSTVEVDAPSNSSKF